MTRAVIALLAFVLTAPTTLALGLPALNGAADTLTGTVMVEGTNVDDHATDTVEDVLDPDADPAEPYGFDSDVNVDAGDINTQDPLGGDDTDDDGNDGAGDGTGDASNDAQSGGDDRSGAGTGANTGGGGGGRTWSPVSHGNGAPANGAYGSGTGQGGLPLDAACGSDSTYTLNPPCGEINPRLIMDFDGLDREPREGYAGETVSFSGTLLFTFDADDNGWAPNDPTQTVTVTFTFPRKPQWVQASMDPPQVEVPILPQYIEPDGEAQSGQLRYSYEVPITLDLELTSDPRPALGYDYGKIQVFARSSESGIYNPGYGVREVRFQPVDGEDLNAANIEGIPLIGTMATLILVGGSAVMVAGMRKRGLF